MVFRIPHPSDARADRPAKHAKAVGPLADPTPPRLHQDEGVIVSRESLVRRARLVGALVQFALVGAARLLVRRGSGHADADGRVSAARARRVVHPGEEGGLEPAHESADHAVLVSPSGLLSRAQAFGFGLHDLRLLLGLVVDVLQRDGAQGLVQQARVLPLDGHAGEGVEHVAEPY